MDKTKDRLFQLVIRPPLLVNRTLIACREVRDELIGDGKNAIASWEIFMNGIFLSVASTGGMLERYIINKSL